jgi:hypothetical protein
MAELASGTGPLFMDPDPEAARAFFTLTHDFQILAAGNMDGEKLLARVNAEWSITRFSAGRR